MADRSPIPVVVWGDSIAAGGWPQRAEFVHNVALNCGTPIRIVNEAVGGMPAATARAQFADRVAPHAPRIVILHFGANDLRHDGARGARPISTPEEFTAHLTAMTRACREIGARVLLLGYHRCRRLLVLPTGLPYDEALRRYSDLARQVAEATGADYLDVAATLDTVPAASWPDFVCEDGVHLSPLGLTLYGDLIATRLSEMVRELVKC